MATLHCILTLTSVFRDYENLQQLLATTNDCLQDLGKGVTCTIDTYTIESLSLPTTNHCVLAIILTVNVRI